ncbi:hypothetical protein M2D63_003630 [Pseudomonas sp. BJa5]|uniref:hypothetical protein n=1 Tax=Pseudomonas sp. BJa5 TaxID=2936270 RepID=UPI0025595BB0|nr:hypothetical protein [Pseudomonas sp. BGr12]MDL2420210.1 hypothetical protein [Pseudomonas sp. BGr12]
MNTNRTLCIHWAIIASILLACLAIFSITLPRPYINSQPYRSEANHYMGHDIMVAKEGLTISEPSAVISLLERMGDSERHAAVGISLVDTSRWQMKVKVEDIQASTREELFDVSHNAELLFSRQYFRLGSILTLAVIPTDTDALCYYLLELDRLRCMNP